MNLPERLIYLRSARRLSLSDLAEQSGISRGYLYLLEKGKNSPTLDILVRLADFYEMHVSALLLPVSFEPETPNKDEVLPFDDPPEDKSHIVEEHDNGDGSGYTIFEI